MKGHRWFAAIYDRWVMRFSAQALEPVRAYVAGGATGRVLEIGIGTGANLAYYDWASIEALEGVEPDRFMLRQAREKARALPAEARVRLHEIPAEELPFPNETFDCVVATLVLCTVQDLGQTLAEVLRVLKPTGSFRLCEHVRANGLLGLLQEAAQPVYGRFAAGCHLNRRIRENLRLAGFRLETAQAFKLNGMPAFCGVAYPALQRIDE